LDPHGKFKESGWFLFLMSLGLLMATELVLSAAGFVTPNFNPSFARNHLTA
jgi:hypothetical protein